MANVKFDPERVIGEHYNMLTIVGFDHDEWWYSPKTGQMITAHIVLCRCWCGRLYKTSYFYVKYGLDKCCNAACHRKKRTKARHYAVEVYLDKDDAPTQLYRSNRRSEIQPERDARREERQQRVDTRNKRQIIRFGRLQLIKPAPVKRTYDGQGFNDTEPRYLLRCDCGNHTVLTLDDLIKRRVRHCGCADGWSPAALDYATNHPGIYQDSSGMYRNKEGFMVLIPTKKGGTSYEQSKSTRPI